MIIRAHHRLYNLATWSFMSDGGSGAVKVAIPGMSYVVGFKDTSIQNPVDPDVLVEVIEGGKGLGVFSIEDLEAAYQERLQFTILRNHRMSLMGPVAP